MIYYISHIKIIMGNSKQILKRIRRQSFKKDLKSHLVLNLRSVE